MPVVKTVLGLDLGTHSLKAVEFRQTLRGLEAVQLRTLPRGDDAMPLEELLPRFVSLHGLGTENVVTALAGDHLSSRRLSFPFTERRRLNQAVPFAVEEELPFDLEDVVIDWEVTGGDRTRADVTASIASRSEVSGRLALLQAAGCPARILEAEGLVLGNLVSVFDLPGRRLLADLGHRKTTLCLLLDERAVAARTLPVGGRHLTEALAADRGLSPGDAERAKCEEGVFDARGEAPPQVAKVLDRLAREIVHTIGAVEEAIGGSPLDEITLFGGTALLGGLDGYLTEHTGTRAARLGLPRPDRGEGLVAGGPPILFAPAIALALRGTGHARTRMNFRQDEFALPLDMGRFLASFRSTVWFAAATVLMALLSFAVNTWVDARRAADLEAQARQLYSGLVPGKQPPANLVAGLREEVAGANERAAFLGVYRGNLSALDLLGELSRLVPQNLDIALEELSIDRQTIRMRVHAKSFQATDRLASELAKFPPFASARIGATERDAKTGGTRFSVTISLKPPGGRS
jgi:general secretion pathway protein L